MRSVYTKTLLSSFLILAFSFLVFLVIVRCNVHKAFKAGGALGGLIDEQALEAERQFIRGGPVPLASYLEYLERQYPQTRRAFLDLRGRDLLSGANRAKDLADSESLLARLNPLAPIYVRQDTADRQYILLFRPSEPLMTRNLLYYYLLLLFAVAVLCLTFRHQFVRPLNLLTSTVRRFGSGDLKARMESERRDELGELGHAFDEMATKIETLLTAERRLLQDISHELRSPLARLSFAVELARSSADRQTAFARVNREIQRLTELIESMIEVTRAEGDFSAKNQEPVSLNNLLKEIAEDGEVEAGPRGCQIRLSTSRDLTLHGNRELLRRALENIVRNAIQHAPERSEISIEAKGSPQGAFISVRDHGTGVPAEHLEAIFRPFYRADDSRTQTTGGVGLGLSIAERAIRVHHGNVWAQNGGPGLIVCVELPVRENS